MDDGERCIGLAEDITNATVEMETIEHERDHDLLTGLINRRAFNRIMNHLFSQGKPVMKTAALIMMDLDDLKYINDTYGHDYGDQYIRCAADCFITFTPKSTVVARYSGDEFFLFFYGYDSKEEIRSKIADMRAGINSRTTRMSKSTF